jgi:REP element-mobilizing transposase RayT
METRFGTVEPTGVVLNDAGRDIEALWAGIPERYPSVRLDVYVVVPNHIHGIVMLGTDPDTTPLSLSVIIGQFKSVSTAAYSRGVRAGSYPLFDRLLWQRGFHDHIVRNERSLDEVRRCIDGNPARWRERRRRQE